MGQDQSFTCENCRGTFTKARPDQEAMAEFQKKFPGHDIEDAGVLCDDCQKLFDEWLKRVEQGN